MHEITIAAQLYTVRDEGTRDFPATLAKVASLGYQNVELAGFGNLASATDVCRAMETAGLRCVSAHVPLEQFESSLSRVLDDQAEIGNQNLVVPWVPEERRKTLADWKGIVKTLNQLGEACLERGFHLSYHHHDFEFRPIDGTAPFDLIWAQTDPQLVHAQIDVYWAQFGGRNPVRVIRDLGSRISSLHLKDMASTPDRRFAPLGKGVLVLPKILETAGSVGVRLAIVEQDDTFETPPLEALAISFEHLRSIGRV